MPSDCQGQTLWKRALSWGCGLFSILCDNIPAVPMNPEYDKFMDDPGYALEHYPAGSSAKSLFHFSQLINLKGSEIKFQKYDYGKEKNLVVYGQEKPYVYDLEKLKEYSFNVTLICGTDDDLASRSDVERLSGILGKDKYDLHWIEGWNHVTWFMAKKPKVMFDILDQALGV